MSVYKELFRTAEQIERKSFRIYPDACDYGMPVKSNDDEIIKDIKSCIRFFDGKVKTDNYSTGATQIITCVGIDEWNTKKEVTFTFTYVFVKEKYRKGMNGAIGYVYVERSNKN